MASARSPGQQKNFGYRLDCSAYRLGCGNLVGPASPGNICGAPAGECACIGLSASGNIGRYEQRAGERPCGPPSRRPPVQRRPSGPDGPRTHPAEGRVRPRCCRSRGLTVRPDVRDPGSAVLREGGGDDAPERVTAQKSGAPPAAAKPRGRPDVNFGSSHIPSARRGPSGTSWPDHCSRSHIQNAIVSFWRVRSKRTDVAAPSESGRILRQPHPRIPLHPARVTGTRAIQPPGRQPAAGYGLVIVTTEKGGLPRP